MTDDDGEVYFHNADDTIAEITLDDEDLPDVNDNDHDSALSEDLDDDSIHTFTGHTSELYAVACSRTNPLLVATGGGDDRGFLWKIGQGDWAAELAGHKDSVTSLAFSSDGELLASGGLDSVVNVWDVSGNLKCTLEGPVVTVSEQTEEEDADLATGFEWVRWHPTDRVVLAGSNDCSAWMWDVNNTGAVTVFSGHSGPVTCGDFTPDGKIICTGSSDSTLRIWNSETGERVHVVRGHPYHNAGLTCLAICSDSRRALTGATDGSVKLVNIKTGKVLSTLSGHSDSVLCIAMSRSSSFRCGAATGGRDQQLIIWDVESSAAPRSICSHESEVTSLTWIGTTRFVAAGCADGDIAIWDGLAGAKVRTLKGHSECIQCLSVSCSGDFLVSGSEDGSARVFEIAELNLQSNH